MVWGRSFSSTIAMNDFTGMEVNLAAKKAARVSTFLPKN
jgi:hypothetical protein